MRTVRLTTAQAIVRYLTVQRTLLAVEERPLDAQEAHDRLRRREPDGLHRRASTSARGRGHRQARVEFHAVPGGADPVLGRVVGEGELARAGVGSHHVEVVERVAGRRDARAVVAAPARGTRRRRARSRSRRSSGRRCRCGARRSRRASTRPRRCGRRGSSRSPRCRPRTRAWRRACAADSSTSCRRASAPRSRSACRRRRRPPAP